MHFPTSSLRGQTVRSLVLCAMFLTLASAAFAQPVVGFVENFSDGTTTSWGGGAITANPGTGGFGGPGDGFLEVEQLSPGHLGSVSFGAEYAGDWSAAGVTQVRAWLKDITGNGNLQIHLSLGNAFQFWQQNAGIVPPSSGWAEYVVNLVAADFTQIRGSGQFAIALQGIDRLHFRHDVAPFVNSPDLIAGAFGLDHILLTNGTAGVGPGVYQPVLLEAPFPNPARGRVTFQLRQPEARPVQISIVDAAGRRIRHVELESSTTAPRLWMWDGTDDAGQPVAAGVYRVIARGDNGGMSRTVTILR